VFLKRIKQSVNTITSRPQAIRTASKDKKGATKKHAKKENPASIISRTLIPP
jgi:hypothetical protein